MFCERNNPKNTYIDSVRMCPKNSVMNFGCRASTGEDEDVVFRAREVDALQTVKDLQIKTSFSKAVPPGFSVMSLLY